MRTHLEFISTAFPALPWEDELINPGRHGKRLADYLTEKLPRHGFKTIATHPEKWGWRIELDNPGFPLWIGCGNQKTPDKYLCSIEHSQPLMRNLFKKLPIPETIEHLAAAIESILEQSGNVQQMAWLTDAKPYR